MKYMIASSVGTDEVHLPDGRIFENQMGGAGISALAGLLTFTDDALLVSGIGSEYLNRHGKWFETNHVSTDGLFVRGGETHITRITYFENGDRIDEPNIGLDQMRSRDPTAIEVARCCEDDTKGIYTFKHLDRPYLEQLVQLRNLQRCALMWEISEDAALPENRQLIREILRNVDIFSINLKEAFALLDDTDFDRVVKAMGEMTDGWVFLRRGSAGAVVISNDVVHVCPPVRDAQVVDPTGCGNASSAAVLYGFCEGRSPLLAGCMGSAAAARVFAQYGIPAVFNKDEREKSVAQAENLFRIARGE